MTAEVFSGDAPVQPDDELLVAYLDNELTPEQRGELENRLTDDEQLRFRLRELQVGWDLLDEMPTVAPNEKLVESTLELVVSDVLGVQQKASESQQDAVRSVGVGMLRRNSRGLLIATNCLLAIGIAAGVGYLLQRQAYRHQLESLTIAEYLSGYAKGGDLDLMRTLNADTEFRSMLASAINVGAIDDVETSLIADTPVDQRTEVLASMDSSDRTKLSNAWDTFSKMQNSQREAIRDVHELVETQPDAERLRQTMQAYAVWREMLPDRIVDAMENPRATEGDSPEVVRQKAIDEAIAMTNENLTRRSSKLLSEESVEAIVGFLGDVVQERLQRGDPDLTFLHRRLTERLEPGIVNATLINVVANGRISGGPGSNRGDSGRGSADRGGDGGRRPSGQGAATTPLSPEDLWTISTLLTDKDLTFLESMAGGMDSVPGGADSFRLGVLQQWAIEAALTVRPWRESESLLDRYNNMSDDERDGLDLLPSDEFLRKLNRPQRFGRERR